MNALAKIAAVEPVSPLLDEFRQCAEDYAWFYRNGILEKAEAADCAQRHAELWGAVDLYGQDEIQSVMADAFEPLNFVEPAVSYAEQLVRQWDLADPRDRWGHTGEKPPPDAFRNGNFLNRSAPIRQHYRTPQATIDAFFHVVRQGDVGRLDTWLADHPKDAAFLLKLLGAKQNA